VAYAGSLFGMELSSQHGKERPVGFGEVDRLIGKRGKVTTVVGAEVRFRAVGGILPIAPHSAYSRFYRLFLASSIMFLHGILGLTIPFLFPNSEQPES
jgi:hypothetical protein